MVNEVVPKNTDLRDKTDLAESFELKISVSSHTEKTLESQI